MKKLISLTLLLVLLAVSVQALAEDDLLARIKKRGTIIIASEEEWAPWTYHDKNDQLVGMDIEIATLIAEGLGVKPDFRKADWDSIFWGIDSKRYDIACNGVGYTEERAQKYTFTQPYVYTHKVLIVRGDNEDIHTLTDIKGRTTANSANSTYAKLAEKMGATVKIAPSLAETIMLLVQGRIDATINAQISIDTYLEQHPDANIKVVEVMNGDPVAIPMRKDADTESLAAAIDQIITEALENGKIAEITMKYTGRDLTKPD